MNRLVWWEQTQPRTANKRDHFFTAPDADVLRCPGRRGTIVRHVLVALMQAEFLITASDCEITWTPPLSMLRRQRQRSPCHRAHPPVTTGHPEGGVFRFELG